ncbi:Zinc finger domain-containing protein [Giardia muris]|uniref:Zinc finger domain-containing protein n=1 Tax=Giardia muris TaxID=5742 RepID=A0A4Z1SYH4_GIAMU|nr:Zinc finger domain-containing protein [Giardia muris]|eukprot:TNJ30530.1 Zinc finger domain-containing protein [Giardia muris]
MEQDILYTSEDVGRVEPAARNAVIVGTLFRLQPGCNLSNGEGRIDLKRFVHSVLDSARVGNQLSILQRIDRVTTVENYKPEDSFFLLYRHYHLSDEPQDDLPDDKYIYIRYERGEAIGCEHYVRGCRVRCEQCQKFFPCRFCHDDVIDDHRMNRYNVTTVECLFCKAIGPVGPRCAACGVSFCKYYCDICHLLCGIGPEGKPNYHCDGCCVCRVGTREEAIHCPTCNVCFIKERFAQHKCAVSIGECVYCLGELRNSIYPYMCLPCERHYCHIHCYENVFLTESRNYKCPMCRKLILFEKDRQGYERSMKQYHDAVQLPPQFAGVYVEYQCYECLKHFVGEKHVVYQCRSPTCGSFNTCELNLFRGTPSEAAAIMAEYSSAA